MDVQAGRQCRDRNQQEIKKPTRNRFAVMAKPGEQRKTAINKLVKPTQPARPAHVSGNHYGTARKRSGACQRGLACDNEACSMDHMKQDKTITKCKFDATPQGCRWYDATTLATRRASFERCQRWHPRANAKANSRAIAREPRRAQQLPQRSFQRQARPAAFRWHNTIATHPGATKKSLVPKHEPEGAAPGDPSSQQRESIGILASDNNCTQ